MFRFSDMFDTEAPMCLVACCVAYLAISLAATIWVVQPLRRSGRGFLIDAFDVDRELADSVHRLLVAGFYLLQVGCVALGSARPTRRPP